MLSVNCHIRSTSYHIINDSNFYSKTN